MPYIIDGDNLIGSSPDFSKDDAEVHDKLIHLLKHFQETRKNNVIIVFEKEQSNCVYKDNIHPKFSVFYPKKDSSLLFEIKRILDTFHNFKNVTLVTSIRELKEYAKDKGAKTINTIEFYFELKRALRLDGQKEESQKRIKTELTEHEIDHWMKIFEQ